MMGMNGKPFDPRQAPPMQNLAIKKLKCECGCEILRQIPLGFVCFNALSPMENQPMPVGFELQCIDCGKYATMNVEDGKKPIWTWGPRQTGKMDREKPTHPEDQPGFNLVDP